MGILSGLANMGLSHLEDSELTFGKDTKTPVTVQSAKVEKEKKALVEKDYIFDKSIDCPVCNTKFKNKTVKTGKARMVKQDRDLRPVYSGVDPLKYDVISCPCCGYSSLSRYFTYIAPPQAKLVKQKISMSFTKVSGGETISYETAIDRYRLALANCIVKNGKDSEKAETCLRMAWTIRGCYENLDRTTDDYEEKMEEYKSDEKELLSLALDGLLSARLHETGMIAGMDETTQDYLLAVLYMTNENYTEAGKLVGKLLTSKSTNKRVKDMSLTLKDEILEKIKQNKNEE